MHEHLEIIMPNTGDIEKKIEIILKPFDEKEDENKHSFFDWYVIGGRWSGNKIIETLGHDRVDEFMKSLSNKGVTVSAVQRGKQSLQPLSQVYMVDVLWREMFPDAPMKQCPLFDHYSGNVGDVMPLKDVPLNMKCGHVIIAGEGYESEIEAQYMVSRHIWNGVTHVATWWDGTLNSAIEDYKDKRKNSNPEWLLKHMPSDNWLVVTVDYHS